MGSPPILLNDLSQPPGHGGHQDLQIVTIVIAKARTLSRVAVDMPSCFMMFLWGTLALQSSMAALPEPASKCLLIAGIVRKHWRKWWKLLSLNAIFYGKTPSKHSETQSTSRKGQGQHMGKKSRKNTFFGDLEVSFFTSVWYSTVFNNMPFHNALPLFRTLEAGIETSS